MPFLPQVADGPTETERMSRLKELYDELLTYLIDEKLIRQIASGSGIRVTDADVDMAIENLRAQNNLTAEQFVIGAGANSAEQRFVYNPDSGILYYDSDGVGSAEQSQIASLSTGLAISNNSFVVIA